MSFIINPFIFGDGGMPFGDDPTTIADLEVWYKADAITGKSDGDPMGNWVDSSGNSRTAIISAAATKPVYKATEGPNGLPCVLFGGSTTAYFEVPDFLTGFTEGHGFSIVKVVADPSLAFISAAPPMGDWGSSFATGDLFPYTDGVIQDGWGTTVRKVTNNPTTSLETQWNLFEQRTASGAWSWRLNGASSGNDFYSTGTNTVGWHTAPRLGATQTNGNVMSGRVAEVIMYSSVLSSGDIQVVYDYLETKYGITLP